MTTIGKTTIKIYTDNTHLLSFLQETKNGPIDIYMIDKHKLPWIQQTLLILCGDKKITAIAEQDVHIIKPDPQYIFPLDITPQHFFYNRYVPAHITYGPS